MFTWSGRLAAAFAPGAALGVRSEASGRSRSQIVGGGCELPKDVPERFPTVIEGMVEDGKLKITIHNLKTGVVQAVHEIAASRL